MHYLPDCGVVKFAGKTAAAARGVAAKAGHNDGHHSHTDVGTFILNVDGESLLCDPGRGLYSKEYFREARYQNIFCNSIGHSVPRIGGQLQAPGPEFGGRKQFHGQIVARCNRPDEKSALIEFQRAYDLPALSSAPAPPGARRRRNGDADLDDTSPSRRAARGRGGLCHLGPVSVEGASADRRQALALTLTILSRRARPSRPGLADECRLNQREGVLTRLAVSLPAGATRFSMQLTTA